MEFDDVDSSCNNQSESNFTTAVINELSRLRAIKLRSCRKAYNGPRLPFRLQVAVQLGDVEYLRRLIQMGYSADISDHRGWSLLHHASAHATDVQCLEELLKYNSTNVDCRTRENETALQIACKSKCGEVAEKAVDLLLQYGADPNLANNGVTPLMYATRNGQLGVVVRLLDFSANPDLHDSCRHTPLHMAAQRGHLEIIKRLLQGNAAVCTWNKVRETLLHVAAKHGHAECLKELLQAVIERGHKEIIDLISRMSFTALAVAATKGHTECVQILLDHGANPNIHLDAFLFKVVNRNHVECLKLLVNAMDLKFLYRESSPFANSVTRSLLDALNNHKECVKVFLCAGYPVSSLLQNIQQLYGNENQEQLIQSFELLLQFTAITGAVQKTLNYLTPSCIYHANYNPEKWNKVLETLKTPSSLKNLCRLKLRESMIPRYGYSFFKSALDSLSFPQKLKKYLLYSE